jgi:hypothetical protein
MSDFFSNKLGRTLALLAHAFLNFLLISWMYKYDITGSWAGFTLFIILCLLLLLLFVKHIVSFIKYLQSN